MKNLLGKIVKPLLIPALAFSMSLKNTDAQKLEFNPGISLGGGACNYSGIKIYDDWQSHFKNFNGDEELKNKKIKAYFECEVEADLGISFKSFSFGINSRYSIPQAIKGRSLSAIELHNWHFDYAKICEATLNQKYPSLGAYIKFPTRKNEQICFRGSFRKAGISNIKREDINLYTKPSPDAKCDEVPIDDTKNIARVFERTKSKTLLNKMGLEYQIRDRGSIGGLELYYETDWNKVHELGLSIISYIPIGKGY